MLAQVISGAIEGVDAFLVRVEVDMTRGLPCMNVVGLAESAVREGRERVTAALTNAGYRIPPSRIIVNLSPCDVPKSGSAFDLPLALGVLAADRKLPAARVASICAVGELGLDGEVRPVRGVLSIADRCVREGVRAIIVPEANGAEAAAVAGIDVYAASSLKAVIAHLWGKASLPLVVQEDGVGACDPATDVDYADVKAQHVAKRALEIAAAGNHNLLMIGPPGSGKSMLARRLPGILPPLSNAESIEVTKVYSVAGRLRPHQSLMQHRPFRAPHHTTSDAAMVGGGASSRPGEVTLAHRGVLFLDEIPEFRRNVLESLRQPVEDGFIVIGRARGVLSFPARFMLVAAMNPCPCGYHATGGIPCICSPLQVQRYAARISGPLLDRIDLHIAVPPLAGHDLRQHTGAEPSSAIRTRVIEAQERQQYRYPARPGPLANAQLNVRELRRVCAMDAACETALQTAVRRFGLSARAYHRVLRVARTIADLDRSDQLQQAHVAEAIHYRVMDRTLAR